MYSSKINFILLWTLSYNFNFRCNLSVIELCLLLFIHTREIESHAKNHFAWLRVDIRNQPPHSTSYISFCKLLGATKWIEKKSASQACIKCTIDTTLFDLKYKIRFLRTKQWHHVCLRDNRKVFWLWKYIGVNVRNNMNFWNQSFTSN